MTCARLSGLDASFLAVETPTAHMHVGWVALFSAPREGRAPTFSELREHIARRLCASPRYRQKLAQVPLGLNAPEWVDDEAFCIDRHLYEAPGPLRSLVDEVMSMPLRRDRPLWEMWICSDGVQDERGEQGFAIIGKAHHCMVDGLAAVELGSLLLDFTPQPDEPGEPERSGEPEQWRPSPQPGGERLLVRGVRDMLAAQLGLLRLPARAAVSPAKAAGQAAAGAMRAARAIRHSLLSSAPASALNGSLSPLRRLAWTERPLEDLKAVKRAHRLTVNDVMLAAVAGAVRAFLVERGERPGALKAMVPVSVRSPQDELGNRISFVFVDLPCEEPHPLGRLLRVRDAMSARKRGGEPEGADIALKAAAHAPSPIQHALSRMIASPRTFNLVVSNIPGPTVPLYMLGCELRATYPVVPLADRHAVSVGMTTVRDRACFGVYADREALPDVDRLARHIDEAIGELLAAA